MGSPRVPPLTRGGYRLESSSAFDAGQAAGSAGGGSLTVVAAVERAS